MQIFKLVNIINIKNIIMYNIYIISLYIIL